MSSASHHQGHIVGAYLVFVSSLPQEFGESKALGADGVPQSKGTCQSACQVLLTVLTIRREMRGVGEGVGEGERPEPGGV